MFILYAHNLDIIFIRIANILVDLYNIHGDIWDFIYTQKQINILYGETKKEPYSCCPFFQPIFSPDNFVVKNKIHKKKNIDR